MSSREGFFCPAELSPYVTRFVSWGKKPQYFLFAAQFIFQPIHSHTGLLCSAYASNAEFLLDVGQESSDFVSGCWNKWFFFFLCVHLQVVWGPQDRIPSSFACV